ncbi:hypothetical protein FXO37_30182 [Capsicum annuum]|nr:hypothetical protein FXO37_30182 [Capsicum annuum]
MGFTNILSKEGVIIEKVRSKHRNDPEKIAEIMKRKALTKYSSPNLTKFQKSVKKRKSDEKEEFSKIASSVASDYESEQEKIEEVMRDQIYMARVLPKFAPHIGCHSVNDIEDRIKSILTKNQYKMFCTKSIFGFFMKKKDCVVQAQLGRCIMSLEMKESSTSCIVIRAKGTILHFTPKEFALVIGLNCITNRDDFVFDEERPNRIIDQYFDGESFMQKKELFAVDSQIPRLLNWKTNSSRPRYETLMESMFDDTNDKVLFKNIEPTRKEISAFQISKKLVPGAASHNEDDIDSNDDFQDPPQRQKQLTTKKIHRVDSSASPAKKKLKPHPKGVWKEFNDMCSLLSSRCDQIMNAINEIKNQAKDTESDQPPTDENVNNTSSHQATPKFDHEFNKNLEGTVSTKSVDGSIAEAQTSESQFTFPDDVLRSIDLDFINTATAEVDADCKNKELAVEMNLTKPTEDESEVNDVDKSKLDQQHKTPVHIHDGVNNESNADQDLPDSQITLPDELLPSLNAYVNLKRSIIVHPSTNKAQQTPMHVSRIRRSSRYKESLFTMNFGSTDDCNFINIVRRFFYVYKVDDGSLNNGGKEYHLHGYISGSGMHAIVPWHTVDVHVKTKHHWVLAVISFNHKCIYVYDSLSAAGHDVVVLSEIEKLAKVIPICLITCKFYENKGIDIDNHPNYKLNEKIDPFGVSVVENMPQQPSGSLDCGLYTVTYVECFTFGEGVSSVDFDSDLIRIRYVSLLWDYATRKAEAEAQSDDEAPMKPLREIELTEGIEVHDI